MRPLDTTMEAHEMRLMLLRAAGPDRRLSMACSMSEGVRVLSEAGVRVRHPEYSDEDVLLALRRLLLGDELFKQVWPAAQIVST
jgi:hypothetical protein